MLSPFAGGRFGAFAPGDDGRRAPAMESGRRPQPTNGSGSNGGHQSAADEGVRIEKRVTYVLQAGDVVRGRATVEGEDRMIVVTNGRVVTVPPAGLLQPALAGPATKALTTGGVAPPDADAKKRKVAMIAGLSLSAVAMVGSIVAGVVADKATKKEEWDPSVDGADGDAPSLWGNDEGD